jgi:hypothetical protein
MKSTLSLIALALLLIAAAAGVTYFMKPMDGEPSASATPQPTPLADDMVILDEPLPGAVMGSG